MKLKLTDINNLIRVMESMKAGKELFFIADNKKQFNLAKKLFPNNIKISLREEKYK